MPRPDSALSSCEAHRHWLQVWALASAHGGPSSRQGRLAWCPAFTSGQPGSASPLAAPGQAPELGVGAGESPLHPPSSGNGGLSRPNMLEVGPTPEVRMTDGLPGAKGNSPKCGW